MSDRTRPSHAHSLSISRSADPRPRSRAHPPRGYRSFRPRRALILARASSREPRSLPPPRLASSRSAAPRRAPQSPHLVRTRPHLQSVVPAAPTRTRWTAYALRDHRTAFPYIRPDRIGTTPRRVDDRLLPSSLTSRILPASPPRSGIPRPSADRLLRTEETRRRREASQRFEVCHKSLFFFLLLLYSSSPLCSLTVLFSRFLLCFHNSTIVLSRAHSSAGHTLPAHRPLVEEWSDGARHVARRGETRGRRATRFADGHVSPRGRPIAARADVSSLTKDVSINEAWVEVGSGVGAD